MLQEDFEDLAHFSLAVPEEQIGSTWPEGHATHNLPEAQQLTVPPL
jgi:hypothetical protein